MIWHAFHTLMFLKAYFRLHLLFVPSKYCAVMMLKALFFLRYAIFCQFSASVLRTSMAARGCNSTPAEGMCIRFNRHCHIINRLLFHSTNNKGIYVRARMEQHSVKSTCFAPYNYYTPSITVTVTYTIYRFMFLCKILYKSISSNSEWN
jgi:hypothetical protein